MIVWGVFINIYLILLIFLSRVFIKNICWILSIALLTCIDKTSFLFCLLTWYYILTEFLILNHPCLFGVSIPCILLMYCQSVFAYEVKCGNKVLVFQSCLILCDPMDCSPPASPVHGTLLARVLEWVDIPFFRGFSRPRDQTQVFCTAGEFFIV